MKDKRIEVSNKVNGLIWLIEMINTNDKTIRQFFVGEKKKTFHGQPYTETIFRSLKEEYIGNFKHYNNINNAMKMCVYLNEKFETENRYFLVTPIYVNSNFYPKPLDEMAKEREISYKFIKETLSIFDNNIEVNISNDTQISFFDLDKGILTTSSNVELLYHCYCNLKEELSNCDLFISINQTAFELAMIFLLYLNQYCVPYKVTKDMIRLGNYTEKL